MILNLKLMICRPRSFLTLIFLVPNLYSDTLSVMTFNVQNLFDTNNDPYKDDKAFLPLQEKLSEKHQKECKKIYVKSWRDECLYLDWNEETKNAKLKNVFENIISFEGSGPDLIAFQEVENINILKQLFTLLKPYGYIDYKLLESKDKRGIDTAYISKYRIFNPQLHYIRFSSKFQTKDTRPIFEATLKMQESTIKIYNAHFPSNYYDLQMRIESFEALRDLHKKHHYPSIVLGDFNISSKDDIKYKVYENQSREWLVAHIEGCNACKGTYYFNSGNSWDFLDSILISKNRGISFDVSSIKVHTTKSNTYKNSGKPYRFDPKLKKGVSDHFAMVAKINI